MNRVNLQLPRVFQYQHDAFFGPERYAVVEGSTKAGKTYPCMLWLLAEMGSRGGEGRLFRWVAPTHSQAEMVYGRMCRMMRDADPDKVTWRSNDTKKRLFLNGLGVIDFCTGEEPDNLYGEDVYGAVMDEFTRQREETWHAVRSTLTSTEGRCRFVGNVKGRKNWGYKLARKAEEVMHRKEAGDRLTMRYAKFTADHAVDEGIMSADELEDARATLPHSVFRELYYAEPSEDGSNPFGISHIRAQIAPLSNMAPMCFGIDLARKADWTVVIGLDENGAVCVFERWHGLSWEHTTAKILAIVGQVPAFADSTGLGDVVVERLAQRSNVEGFQFTQKSKQQLIEGLAVDIQTGKVRYPDGPIVSELEQFEYVNTRTSVVYSAPEGGHDDCVCALALASKRLNTATVAPQFYVGVVRGGKERAR